MYTLAFVTKPIPGMSREAFFDHYQTTHYALSSTLPGLISYQQSALDTEGQPWALGEAFAGYEALSLYTFASRDDAVAAFASPRGLEVDADTPHFMEWESVLAAPSFVLQRFEAESDQA